MDQKTKKWLLPIYVCYGLVFVYYFLYGSDPLTYGSSFEFCSFNIFYVPYLLASVLFVVLIHLRVHWSILLLLMLAKMSVCGLLDILDVLNLRTGRPLIATAILGYWITLPTAFVFELVLLIKRNGNKKKSCV